MFSSDPCFKRVNSSLKLRYPGNLAHTGGAPGAWCGSYTQQMLGGPGDDFIEAKDGARDSVVCGAGRDTISADEEDLIYRDCEIIYRA